MVSENRTNSCTSGRDGLLNPAGELPEFAYQAVPAKFYGMEAQAHLLLCRCAGELHLDLQADMVRATNRDTFPRFRYDQIMRLGWKVFIPITLVWLVVVGLWIQSPLNIWN